MEQFRDELKATGNKGKPIAIKTVNLHLEFYSGLFNHAIQSGRIIHNPVSGVKFSDKRKKQGLNDPFPQADLIKLFHSEKYENDTFDKGWMFWLPILLLYTGARVEELCQLYIDDIKSIKNIWVLDIDETRPDQKVKDHEKRYIPLHPFITDELKFVEYAHSLPDQSGRVFPELKRQGTKSKRKGGKDRMRYGHYPSTNWFPNYKRKECGIVAAKYKKTIHSFRHNVSSCLMEHDVQEYVIAMFMGHEHDQISTGRYGQKFEPDMLMERAVYKLDYGIDLSHLKKSKYVPK
jgi:integrase